MHIWYNSYIKVAGLSLSEWMSLYLLYLRHVLVVQVVAVQVVVVQVLVVQVVVVQAVVVQATI